MVRRAAWTAGFDESMRVAEDVDLVWRTVADGWRVRYEPQAVVRHEHRTDVRNWLGRKAFYGTGAALLAERHGDAVAPMVLTPWTAALAGTLLTQRWWSVPVGVAVYAGTTVNVSRRLRRSRRPLVTAASMTVVGAVATGYQTASALTRHYWPVAAVAAVVSPRARRALLLAAVVDGVLDYRRTRPALDPVRYIAARRLDDLAYGAGVWYGALRARSPRALLPSWQGVDVLRTSTRRI
jgi:mycofactocin system glycosyltransferase